MSAYVYQPIFSLVEALLPDVETRLLAEWDSVHDELTALLKIVRDRDFTHAESVEHAKLVRRIAVISSALHGNLSDALTDYDRAWLVAQGVRLS
jgi:hypothetical protein